ncbi:MAG: phosphoglyceromutase [Actinobacteria bacterium]|nr:phosphoglyceromutase [Actinomycetota bacterium]
MNLVFIRHGQSLWNLENKFTGWVDVGLSERGKKEAIDAGKTLLDNNFLPKVCFTSYLKRSIDTAKYIVDNFKKNDITFTCERKWELNERHYGGLQGLDKIETAKKYGTEQVQIWRRSFDIPPPLTKKNSKHDPNIDDLYSEIKSELPLGESLKDVVSRVKSTYQQILSLSIEKKVIVVAHGNSIRAMVKMLDKLSDEEIIKINIPTGIPLAYNISNNNIEKIGYLGDEEAINNLTKEVEMQSKVADKKG